MNDETKTLLEQQHDLDEYRRRLEEREREVVRREAELATREDAKDDVASSHARDLAELEGKVSELRSGLSYAAEANRSLVEENRVLTGMERAKQERIERLQAALTKRDEWNKKIQDEREALAGKLRTTQMALASEKARATGAEGEVKAVRSKYEERLREAGRVVARLETELNRLRINAQAGGVRR